jgi:prepilin-type N-terminal cleavage/methylation domain-containing protein
MPFILAKAKNKKQPTKSYSKRGFTVIELAVVSALFGLMAVVAVMGQSRLDNNLLIDNMAYEIALAIREAQVYGLATRERASGADDFNRLYGIHFEENSDSFFVYSKPHSSPGDSGKYDAANSVKVDTYKLGAKMDVRQICAMSISNEWCDSNTSRVDIAFIRPNPDARFYFYSDGGGDFSPPGQAISSAKITIESRRGLKRSISVGLTGQINVE